MTSSFGRSLRPLWGFAEDAILLNHGSFGACPLEVMNEQDRIRRDMESQPDVFFRTRIMPQEKHTDVREVAAQIAAFVGAQANDIALIENASAGTQAALRSIPLEAGDIVLITANTYNAVRLAVEARCTESGAECRIVPMPLPVVADDFIDAVKRNLSPRVKLAVLDHITSPSALVLPLERVIPDLRKNGTLVLVDGAHAIGQIPLNLKVLRPDWYVSNAHKWLFAPKGCAFLYASPAVAPITKPNVVSHFIGLGFPQSFDYTGTRDNSGWLAIPAALKFFHGLGPEAIWAYQHRLLDVCTDVLTPLGATPVGSRDMCAAMRAFILPQTRAAQSTDSATVLKTLWEDGRVQASVNILDGKLLLRVSVQIYNDESDLHALARVLDRHGWPGR